MRNVTRVSLVALVALLGVSGCSPNYTGERLFWKAQQLGTSLASDKQPAAPDKVQQAIDAYTLVLRRAPGTAWAGKAQLAIGSLHAILKQYDKAREAYALVLQNYNAQPDICLTARLATAKTYELEQRIEDALKAYQDVIDYHPWTDAGLEAPIFIARVREQRKETEQATAAYEHAVRIYTKMFPDAPTPELGLRVKGYLTLAYQRLGEWEKAVALLEELTQQPDLRGINRPMALLTLGALYQTKLHNPDQAKAVYQKLAQEFPEHPFGKAAAAQLKRMDQPVAAPGAVEPSAVVSPAPASTPSPVPVR